MGTVDLALGSGVKDASEDVDELHRDNQRQRCFSQIDDKCSPF